LEFRDSAQEDYEHVRDTMADETSSHSVNIESGDSREKMPLNGRV
jgi:hypothetical protein